MQLRVPLEISLQRLRHFQAAPSFNAVFPLVLILAFSLCPFSPQTVCAKPLRQNIPETISYGTISRGDQQQCLDIYSSPGAKNWPIVVMIHGGAWRSGDKSQPEFGRDKARFFLANGFIYVSVNYRLAPKVCHPSQIEDIADALAWVNKNIAKYGGSPSKIVLIGHSAGAHLACLAVTNQKYLRKVGIDVKNLRGCILLDSPTFNVVIQNRRRNFKFDSEIVDNTIFGASSEMRNDASPAMHIVENTYVPPLLAFSSPQYLGARYQAKQFVRDLNAGRHDAEFVFVSQKSHVTLNADIGRKNDWISARILSFLNRTAR